MVSTSSQDLLVDFDKYRLDVVYNVLNCWEFHDDTMHTMFRDRHGTLFIQGRERECFLSSALAMNI